MEATPKPPKAFDLPFDIELVDHIARTCHSTNRLIQTLIGEMPSPPWENASEFIRESARHGVIAFLRHTEANHEPPPSWRMHEIWCEYKRAEGWVYGETKDNEAKTHPNLVEWSTLPPKQKQKDVCFGATILREMEFMQRVMDACQVEVAGGERDERDVIQPAGDTLQRLKQAMPDQIDDVLP